MNAVTIKNLHKSYGDNKVLKGVSFIAEKGQILALLGPNGAGKTTMINILATLIEQDKGSVSIAGFDTKEQDDEVRARIGLTGQFAAVDEYLTGRENIRLIGRLYHVEKNKLEKRIGELLKSFDLVGAADKPARTYSGGMKRRLDLAMSLVADPQVMFLDEPTTGLDPRSRITLWNLIKELAGSGRTILLTTQYMDEADFLADNIVVIDNGVVIAEGSPSKLKAKAGADKIELVFTSNKEFEKAKVILKKAQVDAANLTLTLPARQGVDSLKKALVSLETEKIKVASAAVRRPTLDDVFLALTGHVAEAPKKEKK